MRRPSQIPKPNLNHVGKIVSKIEAFADVVNEISDFEKKIKKLVVAAYIDLQSKRHEMIFDRESDHPAQLQLLCYLSCFNELYCIFDNNNRSVMPHVLRCVEWVDSVRENCKKDKWETLSNGEKREVLDHIASMEKVLNRFSLESWLSKIEVLENALNQAVENSDIWIDYYHFQNVYVQRLMEILHSCGVAYWHQSRKVSVQDLVDLSDLSTSSSLICEGNWRVMPGKYAVLGLQDLVMENQTISIPHIICRFFESYVQNHYYSGYHDDSYNVMIFSEKDVCIGTVSCYPQYTMKLNGYFRIEVSSLGEIPVGCEASLVFISKKISEIIYGYSVGLMILPYFRKKKSSAGRKDAVSSDAGSTFTLESPEIFSYLSKEADVYEKMSSYHDDFLLSPSMLLHADVHLDLAVLRPKVVMFSISPKKYFEGNLRISDSLSPIFGIRRYADKSHKFPDVIDTQVVLLYQGVVYTGILRDYAYLCQGTLYFPNELVQIIYKRMETYSSQYRPYFLISFEYISKNTYLLHFGYATESFSVIRNKNPSWQVKLLSMSKSKKDAADDNTYTVIDEDDDWYEEDEDTDTVFEDDDDDENFEECSWEIFIDTDEIDTIFTTCGFSIMKDYLSNPSSVLSFFMDHSSPEWYIEFKAHLLEYVEQNDKRRNRSTASATESVFVPQKVELDWDLVKSASDDLNATAELLSVGYADETTSVEENSPSIVEKFEDSVSDSELALSDDDDDAWKPFADALSPAQLAFVRVMLAGTGKTGDLKRLAKQEGKLLDTYFDELNELAVDTFGDVLIDDGEIVSEYRDALFRVLKT